MKTQFKSEETETLGRGNPGGGGNPGDGNSYPKMTGVIVVPNRTLVLKNQFGRANQLMYCVVPFSGQNVKIGAA